MNLVAIEHMFHPSLTYRGANGEMCPQYITPRVSNRRLVPDCARSVPLQHIGIMPASASRCQATKVIHLERMSGLLSWMGPILHDDAKGAGLATQKRSKWPFVFEKVWSQIEGKVRESAENEKWSGSFMTLDPTLHEKRSTDGLESKSPERPSFWRRKAPRVGLERWSDRIHLHVEYASEMKFVFIRAYLACKPIPANELHETFWEVSLAMLCRSNLMGILPLMADVLYACGQMRPTKNMVANATRHEGEDANAGTILVLDPLEPGFFLGDYNV
ncbi:hypothetical protein EI94DRAFT_1783409 [Lactarius quietus]|nr:hypothetical protein EI94DRAFT_1783409 [Lactarius quietus]